jgi:hypothetical protein
MSPRIGILVDERNVEPMDQCPRFKHNTLSRSLQEGVMAIRAARESGERSW